MEYLYVEYCVEHELRWADDKHDSFYLYFSGGKGDEYRLLVNDKQVGLEKERKTFFKSKWYPVSSRRLDLENRTLKKEVKAKVNEYLQEFQNRQRGGKLHYGVILLDCIEDEKRGESYRASDEDKAVYREMLKEINAISGQHFKYFAELDHYHITGAGEIVRGYINRFQSEWPKAMLLSQMWMDKIDGCDELILNMYYDYKKTPEYLPRKEQGTSANIWEHYDNAFYRMKSKKIESRLIEIMESPLDARILAVTFGMLSKKQPEKMKSTLVRYATEEITPADLGMIEEYAEDYIPPYYWIVEQLKYSALGNLKYCGGDDVVEILQKHFDCNHGGFRDTAKKSYEYIMKRNMKKT